MPPSLPDECSINILSFLDDKSLYKCLYVNRYYCKLSIPIIWREPFRSTFVKPKSSLVINTLISCLNEDEVSLLVPYTIKLMGNNIPPLFEYGKFVRIIEHEYCVEHIIDWLKLSSGRVLTERFDVSEYQDCRVRGLVNVIYHMIMRQGSNLQEFSLRVSQGDYFIDLPKLSTFMTYKPGISNLRSLIVDIFLKYDDDVKCQNAIEFLSTVSVCCNSIVNCDLWIDKLSSTYVKPFLDIIKLQPLERMLFSIVDVEETDQILYALKFRSETLKELLFDSVDFNGIDLSFISKLEHLEHLEFEFCSGFASKHFEISSKKKLHLKKLKLWFEYLGNSVFSIKLDVIKSMIHYLCSETIFKLSFNVVTLETVKAVKESCPNIKFLHIKIFQEQFLDSIIPIICEISSLKFLKIHISYNKVNVDDLVRNLGDHLTSVEYLLLDFHIDLTSFEYFTNNCKANLKKWNILVNKSLRKDYLICLNNFQKVHNSLEVLGINKYNIDGFCWTNEELEIINSLKIQGVDIISYEKFNMLFC